MMRKSLSAGALSLSIALSLCAALPGEVLAQAAGSPGSPTVSVVTLQVLPGPNGAEQVVTPRGIVVPLPGAGVNSNAVQIYVGSQGGYWYVDRYGQTVDLTAAVQQMRARTGQPPQQTAQAPQYAPQPPVQVINEQAPSSGGSGGAGSTLATATAAGLGAMAGAAMTNNNYWNNVPYGTPMYYGAGGHPYYTDPHGNNVNIESNRAVNVNNTASTSTSNEYHANNLQKQQEWYSQQARGGSEQFKNWQNQTENPFVRADAAQPGNAGGQDARHGRFGHRQGQSGTDSGDFQGGGSGLQSGALQGDGGRAGGGLQNRDFQGDAAGGSRAGGKFQNRDFQGNAGGGSRSGAWFQNRGDGGGRAAGGRGRRR